MNWNWLPVCVRGTLGLKSSAADEPLLSEPAKALLRSMLTDVFYVKPTFEGFMDSDPMLDIAERGVVRFERTIFRSLTNVRFWNQGYDFIRYRVFHEDGTHSVLLAYKQARSPGESPRGMGAPDPRPMHHAAYISLGNGKAAEYIYSRGDFRDAKRVGPYQSAIEMVDNFVKNALESGSLFEIQDPEQLVFAP